MSSGDTNDSVYIQKLFTSRDNFTQGNVQEATANAAAYVGQEGRIWWNPVSNAFYYSNGNTPGGIIIGGSANSTANISVSYQGSLLTSNVGSFNFVGEGVVASNVGNAVTVTITGGSSGNVANINNGTSNVVIASANSNVTVGVNGTNNVAVFSPGGLTVAGNVSATGNITADYFIGNLIGNITANITVPGSNTQVIFNTNGSADATAGFTFDKTSNLVTVGGNVSAVGFVGNGGGLANVMADRGGDSNNWNNLTQMGVYLVNRTSWAGTVGTPLDSQIFIGVLEVVNASNTALAQIFYPATVSEDVKIQWNRSYWDGTWTGWILMTNNGQVITGGDF
jgi:hypothetical protein